MCCGVLHGAQHTQGPEEAVNGNRRDRRGRACGRESGGQRGESDRRGGTGTAVTELFLGPDHPQDRPPATGARKERCFWTLGWGHRLEQPAFHLLPK